MESKEHQNSWPCDSEFLDSLSSSLSSRPRPHLCSFQTVFLGHLIKETALLSSTMKPSLLLSFFLSNFSCLRPCLPSSTLTGTCSIRGETAGFTGLYTLKTEVCAGSTHLLSIFWTRKKMYTGFRTISLFSQNTHTILKYINCFTELLIVYSSTEVRGQLEEISSLLPRIEF